MNGGRTPRQLLAAVGLWLGAIGPVRGQDPGPVLDRAQDAYDSAHTLVADFTQIVVNPLIGAPDTTRGTLRQQRPNYFEMRFAVPAGDRIVADGRYLWLYTPSTTPGQVIRSAIPSTGPAGPNLIGQFVDHASERYSVHYVRADSLGPDGAADVIALDPRAPASPIGARCYGWPGPTRSCDGSTSQSNRDRSEPSFSTRSR